MNTFRGMKLYGIVHAKSARKHRKQGHEVRFHDWQHGHCRYEWRKIVVLHYRVSQVKP